MPEEIKAAIASMQKKNDDWDTEQINQIAARSGIRNTATGLRMIFVGCAAIPVLGLLALFNRRSSPEGATSIASSIGSAFHDGAIMTAFGTRQMVGLPIDKETLRALDLD